MPDIQAKIGYLQDDVTKEIFLPKTDASLVTGLEDLATIRQKSNSAYQKPQTGIPATDLADGVIPVVPVTDVTVGGTSVLNSGTAVIPAIPTVPTISTDIQADKSSTTKTAAPSAVYNEVHPAVASSQPQNGFLPNVFYNLGTLTGSVTFALATPADATIVNHYYWTFETGSTAPTITWPSGISWVGGSAPEISADKHYEISVLNGYGTFLEM